jgi:hypothetical protein
VCDDARTHYFNCGIGIVSDDVVCDEAQAGQAAVVLAASCPDFCGVGATRPCRVEDELRQALCDVGFWLHCLPRPEPPPAP